MKLEVTTTTNSKTARNGRLPRQAKVACLIVCSLTICWMASPFTRTQSAALISSAQPIPTPPNDRLDEAGLQTLEDKLADVLAGVIEDEATQTSITNKWDARMANLVGKTARQVVDLFLADVRSVVDDSAKVDQLREAFMAAASDSQPTTEPAAEPVPPNPGPVPVDPGPAPVEPAAFEPVLVGRRAATFLTPEVGIDDALKRLEGLKESYQFEGIIGQLRMSAGMQLSYKGQSYMIYQDLDDPDRQAKFDGINQGVRIMIDKGINLPRNLAFYIAHDQNGMPRTSPFCKDARGQEAYLDLPDGKKWPKCMNIPMAQTWKRDRNWAPVARIVISSLRPPNEKSFSTMGINGLSKIPVTTIHEVCHVLHERFAGEFFWTIPPTPPTNTDVTQYANKAKKEFVAEVCAGLVLGIRFDPRIMTEYQQYRGPETSRRALGQIPLFPR